MSAPALVEQTLPYQTACGESKSDLNPLPLGSGLRIVKADCSLSPGGGQQRPVCGKFQIEDGRNGGRNLEFLPPAFEVPHHDLAIVASPGRGFAVGRHRERIDSEQTELSVPLLAAASDVPDANRIVETGRDDSQAVIQQERGGHGRSVMSRELR